MHLQFTLYILLPLIAAGLSAALALYAWRRRPARGAAPFALLMLTVVEWSLGNALELASTDLPAKVLWANVEYVGIVLIPLLWLVFVLEYTGRAAWLTRRNLALLAIHPTVTLVVIWTNDFHHLFRSSVSLDTSGPLPLLDTAYGPYGWIHAAYSYLLLFICTFLLMQTLVHAQHLYRGQTIALLIGTLAPWAGNALFISDLSRIDTAPFAFVVTGLAVAWAHFRFQLLDLVPVARERIVENMQQGVIVLDTQGRIVDLNTAARQVIDIPPAEALGQPAVQVFSEEARLIERYEGIAELREEVIPIESDPPQYFELNMSRLHDERGRPQGQLILFRDVTEREQMEDALRRARDRLEQRVKERTAELAATNEKLLEEIQERKRLEEQLRHLANHDALTDLPNRRRFAEILEQQLKETRRYGTQGAILALDLDDFKAVNDSLGHAAGDRFLVKLGRRLQEHLRETDTVARLGGDEFVILMPHIDTQQAQKAAGRIVDQMRRRTIEVGGHPIRSTVSAGVALYPEHGTTVKALLAAADAAMYVAKEAGGDRFRVYTSRMD